MFNRGIATFTLDDGKCPPWLFERMVRLGKGMIEVLIDEYGPDEFLKRLADPVWFQSLGTVLAFDWNASGLTTVLTAALKEAIRGRERELGVFICGGKGKTSLKTPDEISRWSDRISMDESRSNQLIYNSKMAAKVDSSLVQDGYQIYHHSFAFSRNGSWAVIQQGMDKETRTARRYHWFSDNIKFHSPLGSDNLVVDPHFGIASQKKSKTLNLSAKESLKTQEVSTELAGGGVKTLLKDLELLDRYFTPLSQMVLFENKETQENLRLLKLEGREFHYHPVTKENFSQSTYLKKILEKLGEKKSKNYESVVSTEGVGPKTLRALALVSEVIYGAKPSFQDPARYSFAHGGKDATPYPVDKDTYDKTIEKFKGFIDRTELPSKDKDTMRKNLE